MGAGEGAPVTSMSDGRGGTVGGEIIDFDVERYMHGPLFAREDVLARLREWLVGERALYRGWVLLLGGPGAGKSAIVMELLRALPRETPYHFIRRGNEGWDRPEVVVQNLCAQIEQMFPEERTVIQQPLDVRLGDLLRRVSRRVLAPYNQRLVLVLDGLDEAASDGAGKNALPRFLPQGLPAGVVILCASRPVHSELDGLTQRDKVQRIDLDERVWAASNEAACRAFWEYHAPRFTPPLDAAFVAGAVRQASGNLLYAIRLKDWLEDQPPEQRVVTNIPKQLSGFLSRIWDELLSLRGEMREIVKKGLGIACVAREALPAYLFGELLGGPASVEQEEFLRVTRPFLREEPAGWHHGHPAYRLYHDYFREFVVQRLGEQTVRELNQLIADKLAAWPMERASLRRSYALRHAVEHRISAGLVPEARQLCVDVAYIAEKCREIGIASVERDLEAVIRALGGESSLDLMGVLAALSAESRRLRARPELLAVLLYNRLLCAGWSTTSIGEVLKFSEGLPRLRLLHGVRLGPTLLQSFMGHEKPLVGCAVTPDGSLLISASADRTLRLWALGSGETVAVLRGHEEELTACAVTDEGRTVISASTDATVRLWDVASQRSVGTLHNQGRWATACGVSPDGQYIVVGSDNGLLTVWLRSSRTRVASLEGHTDYVTACLVTPDGQRIISASRDQSVRVWDLSSGACQFVLGREEAGLGPTSAGGAEKGWVTALALMSQGVQVLAGTGDGLVLRWDLATGRCVQQFGAGQGRVDSCAILRDQRHLLCGMANGSMRVWEIASGRQVREIKAHTGAVAAAVLMPGQRRLVSASSDRSLKLWDMGEQDGFSPQGSHAGPVASCAVTPMGTRAVSASEDGTLKVWDVESGACVATLEGHGAAVTACAISADGLRVLSGGHDGSVRLWVLDRDGAEVATERLEIAAGRGGSEGEREALVSGCAFLGGGRLVTASPAEGIAIKEPVAGQRPMPSGGVIRADGCALTSTGTLALTFSHTGAAQVWDTASGRLVRNLGGFVAPLLACALTPDGKRAVFAREDGVLEVRDLSTGQILRELRGHERRVFGCAVSPDGEQVVSASEDETLRLWSLKNGACLGTVQGTAWFRCVAVASRVICAGDEEGNLWMVTYFEATKGYRQNKQHKGDPISGTGTSPPDRKRTRKPKGNEKLAPSPAELRSVLVARMMNLRDELAHIYRTADNAALIARDAGLNLHRIKMDGTPEEFWNAIIEEGEKSHRLTDVIDRTLRDYPENKSINQAKLDFSHLLSARKKP